MLSERVILCGCVWSLCWVMVSGVAVVWEMFSASHLKRYTHIMSRASFYLLLLIRTYNYCLNSVHLGICMTSAIMLGYSSKYLVLFSTEEIYNNVKHFSKWLDVCVQERLFAARVVYDLLFFFLVIIIVLNLIFGVIIDTFADLRSEKQRKEEVLKTTCFICGKKSINLH